MIDSVWEFMYSGDGVDVSWQLPLVGNGKDTALLSFSFFFFQLLFSMQSQSLWPLTGYAMQNAWAALCRVKLCVRVHCLQLKFCVWALCGWAVARSLSPSLSLLYCRSVCLSLSLSLSLSGAVEDGRSEMHGQFYSMCQAAMLVNLLCHAQGLMTCTYRPAPSLPLTHLT